VKYLIENGANIHVNDDEPLRLARANKHSETVKLLESAMQKVPDALTKEVTAVKNKASTPKRKL